MTDSMSPQRPLLGYLKCPYAGVRWNDRVHPWSRRPCVDLIHLQVSAPSEYEGTLAHFLALGYVVYGGAADTSIASLLLPKLDTSGADELPCRIPSLIQEMRASIHSLTRSEHPTSRRALAAVLGLERAPTSTAEEILASCTPLELAVEYFANRAIVGGGSVLAALRGEVAHLAN